jgi:hypothetical protein
MSSFGRKVRQVRFLRRQSGLWDANLTRQEVSALGTHTVYWVWFDEPQFDADGDGPYGGGQIWESALSLVTGRPH